MRRKDIESLLRSGFEKTAPNVMNSVAERCQTEKGSVIIMNEQRKKSPVLKTALIAVAVAAALAVTAAAVSFGGIIDEQDAFTAAYSHLVKTADGETREDIADLILAGLSAEDGAETEEINIGLKGARPVYKLTFRLGGRFYRYTVDAKTAVVLNYSSEPCADIDYPGAAGSPENGASAAAENVDRNYLLRETEDLFGILGAKQLFFDPEILEDGNVRCTVVCEGYEYTAIFDPETYEPISQNVKEDEDYDGERRLYEPRTDLIGQNKAIEAVLAAHNLSYRPDLSANVNLRDGGQPCYAVSVWAADAGDLNIQATVDAKTGEILSDDTYSTDMAKPGNDAPSTEAPDGMISEAAAVTAALDDIGITAENVVNLKTELSGGEYSVTFITDGTDTAYRVNAKSGKIISKTGCTPDRFIGEEAAIDAVLDNHCIARGKAENITVTRVNRNTSLYYLVEYSYGGRTYSGEADVLGNGFGSMSYPPLTIDDSPMSEEDALKIALDSLGITEYDGYAAEVARLTDPDGGTRLCVTVAVYVGDGVRGCVIDAETGEAEIVEAGEGN